MINAFKQHIKQEIIYPSLKALAIITIPTITVAGYIIYKHSKTNNN